jgi:mannose-6-phosphate isomerase
MHSLHEKVWGSTALSPWYADSVDKIGEVWFDAPADVPLLVKFLFTTENLSVQVHPEDDYAREHHNGSNGKTEMWHILRADPGARIALGLKQRVSAEKLREASVSGEIMDLLNWIEVHPGDSFFTPAGTLHAIGGGIALCEIQQISDITYRLYDYGRARELHLDQGVAVSHLDAYTPSDMASCVYFRTRTITATEPLTIDCPNPSLLICLSGSGQADGQSYRLGQAWHISEPRLNLVPEEPSRFLLTHVPARYS